MSQDAKNEHGVRKSTDSSDSKPHEPWEPSPTVLPLELNLTQLIFQLPITCKTPRVVILANPNRGPIIFRAMMSHEDVYRVKPSYGRIEAHEELQVTISILPNEDLLLDESHEFTFESFAVKEKSTAPLEPQSVVDEYFQQIKEDPETKNWVQESSDIESVFYTEEEMKELSTVKAPRNEDHHDR